jgi:hypothetical protein
MSIINDALKKTQNSMQQSGPGGDGQEPAAPGHQPKLGDDRFARPAGGPSPVRPGPVPGAKPPAAPPPPAPPKPGKGKKPRKILPVLLVLLILAGAGAVAYRSLAPADIKAALAPAPARQPGELQLSGIMTMDGKRMALINNEIYETGDIVQGMRVVEIEGNKVHLSRDGKIVKTLKVTGR